MAHVYHTVLNILQNLLFYLKRLDESKTGASANPSPPVPQLFTTKPGSLGLDTLNEQADKEQFFNDIEGGTSAVDYNKKLHEISTTESVSPDR